MLACIVFQINVDGKIAEHYNQQSIEIVMRSNDYFNKCVSWPKHSNLEDVLIEKKFPKKSDDKFIKYSPWNNPTQIHQDINLDGFELSKNYI